LGDLGLGLEVVVVVVVEWEEGGKWREEQALVSLV
jgi:hypothetical protein